MAENEEFNEEIEQVSQSEAAQIKPPKYEELVHEESEREVNIDDIDIAPTLSEQEEETEQISDLKAVLKYLHPQHPNRKLNFILQSAAASRIFPDNLLDKHFAIAAPYIEENADDDPNFDIMGTISTIQDAVLRGYEGRQRIEDLEIGGVIHEEEMEKLSKGLGL